MKTTGYFLAGLSPCTELYVKRKKWRKKIYKENVVWCHNSLKEIENICKQIGMEHKCSLGRSKAGCVSALLHPNPSPPLPPFLCSWVCPLPLFELTQVSVLGIQRYVNPLSPVTPTIQVVSWWGPCSWGPDEAGCVSVVHLGVVLLWAQRTIFLVPVFLAAGLSPPTRWNVLAPDPEDKFPGSQLLGLLRSHTQEGEKVTSQSSLEWSVAHPVASPARGRAVQSSHKTFLRIKVGGAIFESLGVQVPSSG